MIYMFAERWHLLLFVIKHKNKYKKEAHSNFNHKLFHILSRNLCLETARKFVNKDNKCKFKEKKAAAFFKAGEFFGFSQDLVQTLNINAAKITLKIHYKRSYFLF